MTKLKIMYAMEIQTNKYGLWKKLRKDSLLSSVIFTQFNIFYFPGYNTIISKSANIKMVFWAIVSLTKEQRTTIAQMLEKAFSKKQDIIIFKKNMGRILINR